jgi:hypothetical protein
VLRVRVEERLHATPESGTEVDVRDAVSFDHLAHADEEAVRPVVHPRKRDHREPGAVPLRHVPHPHEKALRHVPGERRGSVEVLRRLDGPFPDLVEDEAPAEGPHPELVERASGNRDVLEPEAATVHTEDGLGVAVLARPRVVEQVVRVEEDENEFRVKAQPLLLEQEELLVGAVARHGRVDDLDAREPPFEKIVERLRFFDAESPREGVAEQENTPAARRGEGRVVVVAQALIADGDIRRPVREDEGAAPAFPEPPAESSVRAEEGHAVHGRRLPSRAQEPYGELRESGPSDEDGR